MSIIPTSVVEDTGLASVITYGPALGIKESPFNSSPAIAVIYQDRTIPLLGAVGRYDEDGVPEISAASELVVVDAEIDGDYIIVLRRSTNEAYADFYSVERYDIKSGRQVSTWDSRTFDWINIDQNGTAYITPYTENWTGYEGYKQEFIRFREKFSFLSIPSHNTGEIQSIQTNLTISAPTFNENKETVDRITNYNPKTDEPIQIDLSTFDGAVGKLKIAKKSKKVARLAKKDIDFIYDQQAGYLYYNENGKEAGFGDGGIFAILEGKPKAGLGNFDFV